VSKTPDRRSGGASYTFTLPEIVLHSARGAAAPGHIDAIAQIFGRARVLTGDDDEHAHYWPAYRWQSGHIERSRPLDTPPAGPLVVVEADRIVYTEHWLRRDGYAPRQFWSRTTH